MADLELIKPRDLDPAANVYANDAIMTDDGVNVSKATPVQIVNAGAPVPTQAEAIAGTDNTKRMTPLTTKQVLDNVSAPAVLRAQAWAESSTNPDPLLPGSKSSKTWAGEASTSAGAASSSAGAANASAVAAAASASAAAASASGSIHFNAPQSLTAGQKFQAQTNMGLGTLATLSPTGSANAENVLRGDGVWSPKIEISDAVETTSGTIVNFNGIPPWVKRISVVFVGVSTTGTSSVQIRIGTSGGLQDSGYTGSSTAIGTTALTTSYSNGFTVTLGGGDVAPSSRNGVVTLTNAGGNVWAVSGGLSSGNISSVMCGTKSLPGTLDRIGITTVTGTNTFDAGTVSITME